MIDRCQFSTGLAVGEAGSATATGYSPRIAGKILSVHVHIIGSLPEGLTLELVDESDPGETKILDVELADDSSIFPRIATHNTNYSDVNTYDGSQPVCDPVPVCGRLKATLISANDDTEVILTVLYEC